MDLKELEGRVQRLEDIEAIKKLKYQYCAYCDDNYNPDAIASLYTEDATWDAGAIGKFEGREAIKGFFRAAPESFLFAIHQVMNPIIDVQGDRATGVWKLFQPCTYKGRAVWIAGIYTDDYAKVSGKWLIKNLKVNILFFTPYEDGWVKKQFLEG